MRVVYSYYVLDIIHRGHLKMMRNAKAVAGKDGVSIIGILTKEAVLERKRKKPILSFDERMNLAEAIEYTDVIVAQETYSPLPNLKKIKPDISMESSSHKEEDIEEVRQYMKSIGGKVIVVPYYPFQSSSTIKGRIVER
ncbi:ADP-heptose synthase, bifunctional sugar kinase/adenylyltransferase [Thermoplasmatales archaeon SCGC AB-539-N05]|nr:ADP-heptose synthase, bifunctional sugar kinase/adenylyltransferase [Thermoplasmatales archaeon SCGC AB-539-N05]ENO12015.1 ADP-heptose synthase, bifunctional sugar kinase/adenylyltransferase [Thermoplasmatales archaeon SCGC AB-539-C06]